MENIDFFVIGAAKCGTSALDSYLSKHPDIYLANNEPNFFAQEVHGIHHTPKEEYWSGFANSNKLLKGDVSPIYIFSKEAVALIHEKYPTAKIIVLYRDPAKMAASWHNQMVKFWNEDQKDFKVAWNLQEQRRLGKQVPDRLKNVDLVDYQKMCSIGTQLKRVFEIVPRDQILVIRQDDLMNDTRSTYLKVLDFLGLKDDGQSDFKKVNPSAKIRSPFLHKYILRPYPFLRPVAKLMRSLGFDVRRSVTRANFKSSNVTIDPEFETLLRDTFKGEVEILESLLETDLREWKP